MEVRVGEEDLHGTPQGVIISKNSYCGRIKDIPKIEQMVECFPNPIKGQFVSVQKYSPTPVDLYGFAINEIEIVVLM